MDSRWMVLAVATMVCGCDKPAPPAPADQPDNPLPLTKEAVQKEMKAADDGPDCATFVKEVQQACRDHYARGLDVNCNTFITSANTAMKQKGGGLFKDPSGKNPDAARQAGVKMCAMMGKRLRKAVGGAATAAPGPNCVKLGKSLETPCFAKIGTPGYDDRCNGLLVATTKLGEQSDKMCEMQMAFAGKGWLQ